MTGLSPALSSLRMEDREKWYFDRNCTFRRGLKLDDCIRLRDCLFRHLKNGGLTLKGCWGIPNAPRIPQA